MLPADLSTEQAYIDRAYAQLTRMRARAEHLLSSMKGADPDLEWALLRRVRALADTNRALCFGRIDHGDGVTWYVGRRHVEDEDGDPVVIEWRAPVALPYYRASWREPMGLVRRRQFVVDGRELLSIGDDHFGADERAGEGAGGAGADGSGGQGSGLRGRDALLVELERARSGEMIDIVATIQPEQDEVIRSEAAGILAVQGGPGSGKTAVGLHRAAFLLYGDDAMARANVLVVGPNRTFLRYIAQVLPSLGEQAVVQTTLVDLVPEIDGAHVDRDDPDVERVKGDGRMAEVLARALAARRSHDDADVEANVGLRRLVVAAEAVNAAADLVASRDVPYSVGRDMLRRQLLTMLAARWEELTGAPPPDSAAWERQLRNDDSVKAALDRRWPSVPPTTLVSDLLTKPNRLAEAADGILSPTEQRRLRRRRARAWTSADAPLVDEAKDLIAGQSRTYGHVIVDEAQDLSPMQLRMLARRCPSGSMTLLGDLAQAVGVWGHRQWEDMAAWLPTPAGIRTVELRLGYRSPAQVLDLASRLLPDAAPDVRPTEAVRPGRSEPRRLEVGAGDLLDAVAGETERLVGEWPTVAVIAPDALVGDVLAALRERLEGHGTAAKPVVGDAGTDGLGRPVTVVAAEGAKGLEFDAVIVVEPDGIVAERRDRPAGLRLLYVALTRPTQHLSIVSSTALPEALAA
ncbi:MAG TPA: ATP-binding domain-containing protein [Acidimicrobiales bacterium]|nr:ATP-binding domain-containing protein [Acidimicrobiales bacterium]